MPESEIIQEYYNSVKPHMDASGWFPDDILGDSFWVLSYCERKWIGDKLFWRFTTPPSTQATHSPQPREQ